MIAYFQKAISSIGATGVARLHFASFLGPIPRTMDSDGPHFKNFKKAVQEVWRNDDGTVSVDEWRL